LVAVSLFVLAIAVLLGVFLDLSRAQTARRRIQIEADAAALDAVRELDGTAAGIERARAVVSRRSQGAAVETEFWNAQEAEWNGSLRTSEASIALRVRMSRSLPLYFMPVLGGASEAAVDARAAAAQEESRDGAEGLFPYAAIVNDAETLSPGTTHELAWASGTASMSTVNTTINSGGPGGVVRIGDRLAGGAPEWLWQRDAVRSRVAQDADGRAPDYASYSANGRGNGRRIVLLPLVSAGGEVTGFGAFLLPPMDEIDQAPLRAEYVGAYLEGSRWRAAAGRGAWVARLIQ
jgi:hypothetical protein